VDLEVSRSIREGGTTFLAASFAVEHHRRFSAAGRTAVCTAVTITEPFTSERAPGTQLVRLYPLCDIHVDAKHVVSELRRREFPIVLIDAHPTAGKAGH
jgi:hypothetical protein